MSVRLAAIDIGSNAARLLISDVVQDDKGKPVLNNLNLVRVPLRLGFDVFEHNSILPGRQDMIINTIQSYKYLLQAFDVKHYKACATSAMRDAENSLEVLSRVKEETGITIQVITGDEEASIVYESHIAEDLPKKNSYLYIDVGGGSTELTMFSKNRIVFKQSFDIGTIRLIKNQVDEIKWNSMEEFIKGNTTDQISPVAIGLGGNINAIFSMSKKKDGRPLSLKSLEQYHTDLGSYSLIDRMRQYHLSEDRADVIVPALMIFINVMRWAGINKIFVPKIGLADGLIRQLFQELKLQNVRT